MRYYDIQITSPSGGQMVKRYTSFPNNQPDLNALLVELDILVAPQHQPFGNSFIRVWGVSLQDIAQASNLNGMNIKVFGGMQAGLPLANPRQSGLLVQGAVQQAFGNWIDTTQTLDLLINAAAINTDGALTGVQDAPANIVFNWPKGQTLAQAIATTLSTAAPGFTQKISISPNLVYTETATGFYQTFTQFAQMVQAISKAIIGGNYPGVSIVINGNAINVMDGTSPPPTTQIAFSDMIGQATWIGPATIQLHCVMRADLDIGSIIMLPPGQIATTSASLSQFRDQSVFQGTFMVTRLRHVGNSRTADGTAWVTVIDCVPK